MTKRRTDFTRCFAHYLAYLDGKEYRLKSLLRELRPFIHGRTVKRFRRSLAYSELESLKHTVESQVCQVLMRKVIDRRGVGAFFHMVSQVVDRYAIQGYKERKHQVFQYDSKHPFLDHPTDYDFRSLVREDLPRIIRRRVISKVRRPFTDLKVIRWLLARFFAGDTVKTRMVVKQFPNLTRTLAKGYLDWTRVMVRDSLYWIRESHDDSILDEPGFQLFIGEDEYL